MQTDAEIQIDKKQPTLETVKKELKASRQSKHKGSVCMRVCAWCVCVFV